MTRTAVYSDDPAVTAVLSALTAPLAVALALSAVAYGVEEPSSGAARLGTSDAAGTFVGAFTPRAYDALTPRFWAGMVGARVLQGLRICQHWCHLAMTRPFWEKEADLTTEEAAEADGRLC